MEAGAASMIASIEPIIAALLAVTLLGERPHLEQGVGILCIVVAAIITEKKAP
jgi:drug/metabolite transporter (DMT)-like permease